MLLFSACSSGQAVSIESSRETVVATTGATVGQLTTSTTEPSLTTPVESSGPITGYGDFGGIGFYSVDWALATELMAACVIDQGFPVRFDPVEISISAEDVPADQNAEAGRTLDRCTDGLNLPEFVWPNTEQLSTIYQYSLAIRDCLNAEGFDIPEPPSFEAWGESYQTGPWMPYNFVQPGYGWAWAAINAICPQSPVGGWVAWEPGDPITPALADP